MVILLHGYTIYHSVLVEEFASILIWYLGNKIIVYL